MNLGSEILQGVFLLHFKYIPKSSEGYPFLYIKLFEEFLWQVSHINILLLYMIIRQKFIFNWLKYIYYQSDSDGSKFRYVRYVDLLFFMVI